MYSETLRGTQPQNSSNNSSREGMEQSLSSDEPVRNRKSRREKEVTVSRSIEDFKLQSRLRASAAAKVGPSKNDDGQSESGSEESEYGSSEYDSEDEEES